MRPCFSEDAYKLSEKTKSTRKRKGIPILLYFTDIFIVFISLSYKQEVSSHLYERRNLVNRAKEKQAITLRINTLLQKPKQKRRV